MLMELVPVFMSLLCCNYVTAWSLYTLKDINSVESTQRLAARFVFSGYSGSNSVSSMLEDLNWPLLRECHIVIDLTMFYKINRTLVNIPLTSEITPRLPNARRSNDLVFMHLPSSVKACKYSFTPRTIPEWNRLPLLVVDANSIYSNRMWFSMVCALIDNDTLHHSGQNLFWTKSAAPSESRTFWPLWWRILLSIRVQTTLNHIRFVKFTSRPSFCVSDFCVIVYSFRRPWPDWC